MTRSAFLVLQLLSMQAVGSKISPPKEILAVEYEKNASIEEARPASPPAAEPEPEPEPEPKPEPESMKVEAANTEPSDLLVSAKDFSFARSSFPVEIWPLPIAFATFLRHVIISVRV